MKSYKNKNIKISYDEHNGENILYSFDELLYTDTGQDILKKAHEFKMQITCICNGEDNPIPMTNCIMPSRKGYYLRRNKGTMNKHNRSCPLYNMDIKDILSNTEKKKPISNTKLIKESDGNFGIVIRSNGLIDNKAIAKNGVSDLSGKEGKRRYKSKTYSTIYGIGDILLSQAWNTFVTDKLNYRNPREGNIFYMIYNQKINFSISTNVGTSPLKEVMLIPFIKERESEITGYAYRFIFNTYNKIHNSKINGCNSYILGNIGSNLYDYDEIGDYYKVKVTEPFHKNYYYIYVNSNYFIEIRNRTRKVIGADYYISAFVHPEDEMIIASEIAFIPVFPKMGFTVDSSKEIEFAKKRLLEKGDLKEILFIKPPKYAVIYNLFQGREYIPDFLLLEKETRKVATVIEIFGYYTDEYMKEQEEKIEFYSGLERYHFIGWEANKGKGIPYVPRIQKCKSIN